MQFYVQRVLDDALGALLAGEENFLASLAEAGRVGGQRGGILLRCCCEGGGSSEGHQRRGGFDYNRIRIGVSYSEFRKSWEVDWRNRRRLGKFDAPRRAIEAADRVAGSMIAVCEEQQRLRDIKRKGLPQ